MGRDFAHIDTRRFGPWVLATNAGDMVLGGLVATGPHALVTELRLDAGAHLSLAQHVGRRPAERGPAPSGVAPA
jgi:hypothetical protein